MVKQSKVSRLLFQRTCLGILIICYTVYALHRYFTEGVIDLLTAQFILSEPVQPIKADQVSTYVIGLDSTPKRYALLKPQLDKSKIKHTKFSAVNGYNIKITDENQNKFYGKDIKSQSISLLENKHYTIHCPSGAGVHVTTNQYTFSAGEFGCYCSHREVWHDIVNHNIKYALILEDDARLSDNFRDSFDALLNNAPKDWDIIYLYINPKESIRKFTNIVDNSYFRKINASKDHMYSFVAYMVSHEGAKKLLENSTTFSLVIDVHSARLISANKLKAYRSDKEFVTTYPKTPENSVLFQMGRYHY